MFAFRTPIAWTLGDVEGMTAGRGNEGAGETDRRIDLEEPKEDLRLCEVGGGSIGRARLFGVPGADGGASNGAGAGEPGARALSETNEGRPLKSGGAGLFDDILLAGRSIFATLLCCAKENCPSLVFNV